MRIINGRFVVVYVLCLPTVLSFSYHTKRRLSVATSLSEKLYKIDGEKTLGNEAPSRDDNDDDKVFAVDSRRVSVRAAKSATRTRPNMNLFEYLSSVASNFTRGRVGRRGEIYVVLQFVLLGLLCIDLPELAVDTVCYAGGSFVVVVGAAVVLQALLELGDALSPFPIPIRGTRVGLVTTGVYRYIRHPMYTGLLCLCVGGSLLSESVVRFFLTVLLYGVLHVKSMYEDEGLEFFYQVEFSEYRKKTGRFLPKQWTDRLPYPVDW